MFYGRVVGSVVCTAKDAQLQGLKLLVVQRTNYAMQDEGGLVVAADTVRAGVGDFVCLAKGKESSLPLGDLTHPLDAAVVGIIDRAHVDAAAAGR